MYRQVAGLVGIHSPYGLFLSLIRRLLFTPDAERPFAVKRLPANSLRRPLAASCETPGEGGDAADRSRESEAAVGVTTRGRALRRSAENAERSASEEAAGGVSGFRVSRAGGGGASVAGDRLKEGRDKEFIAAAARFEASRVEYLLPAEEETAALNCWSSRLAVEGGLGRLETDLHRAQTLMHLLAAYAAIVSHSHSVVPAFVQPSKRRCFSFGGKNRRSAKLFLPRVAVV